MIQKLETFDLGHTAAVTDTAIVDRGKAGMRMLFFCLILPKWCVLYADSNAKVFAGSKSKKVGGFLVTDRIQTLF
jgi:hypothetical protein